MQATELRQNLRHASSRPIAWDSAVLIALALGLLAWYALPSSAPAHRTSAATPLATSVVFTRNGGPGGQIGDSPQPDQTSRDGGPGGQIGDAPFTP
jgi:hypothetical protein